MQIIMQKVRPAGASAPQHGCNSCYTHQHAPDHHTTATYSIVRVCWLLSCAYVGAGWCFNHRCVCVSHCVDYRYSPYLTIHVTIVFYYLSDTYPIGILQLFYTRSIECL